MEPNTPKTSPTKPRVHGKAGAPRTPSVDVLPLDTLVFCSEDLLALRDFSEPALLHTLRVRFNRRESYTAVGTILISVNPYSYHNYEEIYGDQVMDM